MPTMQKTTSSTNSKREMKTKFNPKACITCPKCCTYPQYQDHVVFCPNCGFKVELKPHHEPVQHWDEAVRKYELEVSKGRTTYQAPPKKSKDKKKEEEFTPETEKKKRYPEAYNFPEDYFDGDGLYWPACSERSSRERLGFEDASRAHFHRSYLD